MLISNLPSPLAVVLAILWALPGVFRGLAWVYHLRKAETGKERIAIARAFNGRRSIALGRRSPDEDTMSG